MQYREAIAIALALGIVGCGDDEGSSTGQGGGGAGAQGSTTSASGGSTAVGGGGGAGGGASVCTPVTPVLDADLYVGPSGSPTAAGTVEDPLDLATALSSAGPATPGDVVGVLGGTYLGRFTADVSGEAGAPIAFVAMPTERVTLDGDVAGSGNVLTVDGAFLEFVDLEIMSSDPNRVSAETGSAPSDITLAGGVTIYGPNVKLIRCVIHDTAQGISFWTPAVDGELYGNLVFNNGWEAPDRGHGHAIYTQNLDGTKRIVDNTLFFGFSYGIHAYTEGGSIQGFDIVGNVWFETGASVTGDDGQTDGCLVGGLQPAARVDLTENTSWAPAVDGRNVRLGYSADNEDVVLTDNFFVGSLWFDALWSSIEMSGNTVYGDVQGIDTARYPGNTFATAFPTGQEVLVRPDVYDATRARIVVHNWDGADTADVDLRGIVSSGAPFAIRSAYDPYGPPVVEGVFDGAPVAVPMGSVDPPQPNGLEGAIVALDDPGKAFGVFLLSSAACAR